MRLQPAVQQALGPAYEVSATAMMSQIGSGAMPVDQLPSYGLAIRPARGGSAGRAGAAANGHTAAHRSATDTTHSAGIAAAAPNGHAPVAGRKAGGSLDRLEASLRGLQRPIIGRIADKTLWLDLRCMEAAEEPEFLAQLSTLQR
jgi:L-seryl-tRNA(Ser) seleniumtransferase